MQARKAATLYQWKAAPGQRRYHAVSAGKPGAMCGKLLTWNHTAYAVDKTNTCRDCWQRTQKEQG